MPGNGLWDVIVVGGGPAGMIAAGRAGQLGRSVLLLEKNAGLGKKLLITGGGRCNITNNRPQVRAMLEKYKGSDQFLFSAFTQFGVAEALKFFNDRGLKTKEEAEGRVFPMTEKARSVWGALVSYMKAGGVRVRVNAAVVSVEIEPKTKRFVIKLKTGEILTAKACILATGGMSRPETGSTGEGFNWLKKLGHTVIANDFALVPVALKDSWVKKLAGLTLNDIKLTVFQDGVKQSVKKGKLLFTHFGISGPTVLNLSKEIAEFLGYGEVVLMLDLFPTLEHGQVKQRLQELLTQESNKKLKNSLSQLAPAALVVDLLKQAGINGEAPGHSVRSTDRVKIVTLLKAIPLHVKGLLGANKAVVSSGGVALKEVDFRTMESRLVPNLYIIGDLLNIDRPSGGYSLQLCWTTGFVAGTHSAAGKSGVGPSWEV